jgi:hypothetical protein
MTRLCKYLLVWFGLLLVLTACSTTSPNLTMERAENAEEKEDVVMTEPTSSEPTNSPTVPPSDSPTTQPKAEPLPTSQLFRADFPNLGVAPEIENEIWLNTDEPVTLASQQGKVVLVEFWTFG